jgi:hypothetical protein
MMFSPIPLPHYFLPGFTRRDALMPQSREDLPGELEKFKVADAS